MSSTTRYLLRFVFDSERLAVERDNVTGEFIAVSAAPLERGSIRSALQGGFEADPAGAGWIDAVIEAHEAVLETLSEYEAFHGGEQCDS